MIVIKHNCKCWGMVNTSNGFFFLIQWVFFSCAYWSPYRERDMVAILPHLVQQWQRYWVFSFLNAKTFGGWSNVLFSDYSCSKCGGTSHIYFSCPFKYNIWLSRKKKQVNWTEKLQRPLLTKRAVLQLCAILAELKVLSQ